MYHTLRLDEKEFSFSSRNSRNQLYTSFISLCILFLRIVGSVCSRYYLAIQINLLLHHGSTSRSATLMSAVQSFSVFFFHSLAVLFYHYIYKSIVFYQKCILDLNQMKIRKSGYQYRENGEQYSKKLGSIRVFLNKVLFLNFKRHDGRIILILTTLRGLHG